MSRASNLTIADQWTTLIRREDDGETFVAAVLNITSSDMEVILTCKDRDDPKDETEAGILAAANLYAGRKPPNKVYEKLGNSLPSNPPRRRIYSNLPWSEKKDNTLQFAVTRDQELGLIDNQGNYLTGSLSHHGDHNEDAQRAGRCGIPRAGIVPEPVDNTAAYQAEIARLTNALKAEKKRRSDTQDELKDEVKRRREVETDLDAEKCRFKNEEARTKNLEGRLNDELETVARLRHARDTDGSFTHAISPAATNRNLNLSNGDQEDAGP